MRAVVCELWCGCCVFGVIRQVLEAASHSPHTCFHDSQGSSLASVESSMNTAWARNSRFEFSAVNRVAERAASRQAG